MPTSFDVERGLLSKLLETSDMEYLQDQQITEKYFNGEAKNVFRFICDTVKTTGEIPTLRVIKRRFPTFTLEYLDSDNDIVGTRENIKFWVNEVRVKARHNTLADAIDQAANCLQNYRADEAFKVLRQKLSYIDLELTETKDIDITQDVDSRIAAYERKKTVDILGVPTGIGYLDYLMRGLEKKTLTVTIGTTAIGKTWLEILIGVNCMMAGFKVLQFVTEMSEEIMQDRYEALLFAKKSKVEFSYNDFKRGKLLPVTEKSFFKFLKDSLGSMESLIVVTATSVMSVAAALEKYKPDIALIDSAYLMEDDQRAKDDWLRVAHISRDLKKLAKSSNIPIFINSQADKSTSRKAGPEIESIMYTQAIGQDADNILGMFRTEDMRNSNEMCVKVLKQREGSLGRVIMNWDFNTMNFDEIFVEGGEEQEGRTVEID